MHRITRGCSAGGPVDDAVEDREGEPFVAVLDDKTLELAVDVAPDFVHLDVVPAAAAEGARPAAGRAPPAAIGPGRNGPQADMSGPGACLAGAWVACWTAHARISNSGASWPRSWPPSP